MKMTDLIRHDIPADIVQLWQCRQGHTLLPIQDLAINRFGLFSDTSLLIQAPTSSGKTFVGEMAAIQTALRRKQVVYLVPLKALAEEKFRDFRDKYGPYGLEVIISTRDHREYDQALENGNFSIAVVVYEKLEQLLVRRPERIAETELVIADEVELLSDPDRGADVEVLLTQLRRGGCRLIALSAVLGHAEQLARWLNAELVQYDRRPSELRYGVIHDGAFRYRTYNEFSEAEESMVDLHSDSAWEILTENLSVMVDRGEPCLVFVKSRHESRRGAELLAQRIHQSAAMDAIERLSDLEATRSRDSLLNTLNQGVAFHNADLSPDERRVVEEAFRAGEIKVLVATSTLAQGLNLPAQNVFVTAEKWRYDNRFGMPWKTPVLRGEYENMGGRAGRYGAGADFGRSILVAPTAFDMETLWRRYVEGQREGIEPRLAKAPLENHVLRLVAARVCRNDEELLEFLNDTLSGRWIWAETLAPEEVGFRVRAAVNRAVDAGLVLRAPDGRLEATPFGLAVASKGISQETAVELEHWIRQSEKRAWSDLDLLLAAALTVDGRLLQLSLTTREYDHANYHAALKAYTEHDADDADVPLTRMRSATLTPFYEEVRAIKGALILYHWLDHAPLMDLEEQFHTMTGQILSIADQIGWIVDAAAALAQAFNCDPEFTARLERFAERVQYGLHDEALPLARCKAAGLSRKTILELVGDGLHTPDALAGATPGLLQRWLSARDAQGLIDWARRTAGATAPSDAPALQPNTLRIDTPSETPLGPSATDQGPALIVDERQPGQIRLDGKTIALQEKQFRLVQLLARNAGECVPYETIYQSLWGDLIVENNQMHFQKRKLLNAVANMIPGREPLVKTIPKRGFLLDLPANRVALIPQKSTAAA